MAARDPTVEEYAIRFVRKYLKVSAPRVLSRAPRLSPVLLAESPPRFPRPRLSPSSSLRATPLPAPRAPSSPQGDFARAARTNDDDGAVGADDANRAAAADAFVDLLRKCAPDAVLLKVPLRVVRDEILRRYDEHRTRRDRDRDATQPASSSSSSSLPGDVESLFALFDGVHRVCVTLASRLTAGPYETIDRALRLRLFLCVCGETWRDAPALRAAALRRCHAFAREEDAHEEDAQTTTTTTTRAARSAGFSRAKAAPAASSSRRTSASSASSSSSSFSSTSSSGWLGSIASRAVPAFVSHDAVDVSSWRRVIGQVFARCPAKLMSPTVECLLESLRLREDSAAANANGPIASRQLALDANDATTEYVLYGENTVVRADANPPATPAAPPAAPDLLDAFDGFDVTTPIVDDDRKNLTAGWETFETPPTTMRSSTDGRSSSRDEFASTGDGTGEKGLVFDGSFGSDASLTSTFRPATRADFGYPGGHGTSSHAATGATWEPPAAASVSASLGAFGSSPAAGKGATETPPGKEPSRSSSSGKSDGSGKSGKSGKLGALASVAARLPVRDSHDFDELVRDLERM